MKVIVVANQKGGSGKSTVLQNLAVAAARDSIRVAVADTDPQGTTADWFNAREATDLHYLQTTVADLSDALAEAKAAQIETMFIDTPPAITEQNASILQHADLVLVPLCASPNDLRALSKMLPLLQASGKPFMFVLCRVNPQAKFTLEIATALSEHGPIAHPPIRERIAYPTASVDGRGVIEIDKRGPAAAEVIDLWRSVIRKL